MCVAIPSKLVDIQGQNGMIEIGGIHQHINLMLVDNIQVGDYVIVHAGFAIHKLDETEALETLSLMQEMAA